MEKKQATILSFFKQPLPAASKPETADRLEPRSRPTTASSSPRALEAVNEVTRKKAQPETAWKAKAAANKRRAMENDSFQSSASSSGSSSESDSSINSSSASDSDESPRRRRKSPEAKKAKLAPEEVPSVGPAIDVESLFSFGACVDTPQEQRKFQRIDSQDSSEPILSTEEIDKLCKGVPPFIQQFTRLYYELSTRFDFPSWYNPKNLRDKHQRSPSNPEYDVSSLFVPRKNGKVVEDGHSTPMLQQYWDIKQDHFNEIILFKVGKFYELFYIDAAIAQQVCQLKWMGHDRRAHVGFPETSLQHHAAMLIEQGFTVCVVEQTETVSEANERSANAGRKSTGALVERKICEVFTTGTLIHEEMLRGRSSHYLCCVSAEGVVMVDCATGQFQVGPFSSLANLKTIIYSFQPREIVFDPKNVGIDSGIFKLINGCRESLGAVVTRWTSEDKLQALPERLLCSDMQLVVEATAEVASAVRTVVSYLKHLLLDEQVVQCGDWKLLKVTKGCLVMDSTVLAQLEILKDSEQSDRGSLFKFVDRTATPFGSRLMQRWVCAPLANSKSINERIDAVEWLVSSGKYVLKKLEEKLKQLPDLERRLQRICAMALQQQRNAVYFGEVENNRIGVFLGFLSSVEGAIAMLEWLSSEVPENVALLKELSTHEGVADKIKLVCQNLKGMIETKKDGSFRPRQGAFEEYDSVTDELRGLDNEFKAELNNVKESLKIKSSGEAIYVSIKYKNEIEVPVDYESRVKNWTEAGAEVTSCRKGYVRFQTDKIRELVQKSDDLEQQLKDLLYPFMAKLFGVVNEKKFLLGALISRIAQIDCLLALGKLASQGGRTWCRPVVGSNTSADAPLTVKLVDSRHPIQEHLMQLEREFVPNTLMLGENCGESIVLLTGANMGGKSTILRQVCVNIILAQMGSFVPASCCEISAPVDRIFTRIGASDNILEGKSTFLTELEETAVMLREASNRSLLVIDELGRGTSTYDGVAIAGATLAAISKKGCICLFATHYHKLCDSDNVEDLRKTASVGLYHMECLTKEDGKIELTHKFRQGLYPHSQAMHVAQIAGIPESILVEADGISQKFLQNAWMS